MGTRDSNEYTLEYEVAPGIDSALWRARRPDGSPVLLQYPRPGLEETKILGQACHELEVLQRLQSSATLGGADLVHRTHEGASTQTQPAIVFNDEGTCESLETRIQRQRFEDLSTFYPVAIALAEAVGEFHQRGVVHNRLSTDSVLLTERGCLISDFSQASRFPECVAIDLRQARNNLFTLSHISPEQTGRLNRRIDYRTDIYSLGVIFFRMLTGEFPLAAEDVVGWVHAHVAQPPKSPTSLRPNLPSDLVLLLLTLLAKNGEERYQSAFQLAHDLRALATGGSVDVLLSSQQCSGRFRLSSRIYGRAAETAVLRAAFERVAEGGREVVFVCGYSGVGKTVLVHETHRPLVERSGRYCAGKFGQFGRSTPHSAVLVAINELVEDILTLPQAHQAPIVRCMHERVGVNLAVLSERLASVEALVGKQPAPQPLNSADAQARFHSAVIGFLSCIASGASPLVIFLDDLQWSDLASLRLLEEIQSASSLTHILLIGAYRNNEVDEGHPLVALQARLAAIQSLERIELAPLTQDDITNLIADSFQWNAEEAEAVSARALGKTRGNPFFTKQLLTCLYNEEALFFDFAESRWRCDLEEVANREISENVVHLMVRQLREFDAESQRVLGLASCIGPQFDLRTLAAAGDVHPSDEHELLGPFLANGFLKPVGNGHRWMELGERGRDIVNENASSMVYRFAHDRVQQAAQLLIPDGTLPSYHLCLAQVASKLGETRDTTYLVAGHYNEALGIIRSGEILKDVVEVNIAAADLAELEGAHETMLAHASVAVTTLSLRANVDDRELILKAYEQEGKAHMLLGNSADAGECYEKAFACCESALERVAIDTLRMEMNVAQGQVEVALSYILAMLADLGVNLTPSNVAEIARDAPEGLLVARSGLSDEDIVNLSPMRDATDIALVTIAGKAIDTAFMSGREWLIAITSTAMVRCLRKGMAAPASVVFAAYGVIDAEPDGVAGFRRRYEYGRIGSRIAERYAEPQWISATSVSNIPHYSNPFREAAVFFDNASDAGWRSSNLTWAAYATVRSLFMCLTAGQNIDKLTLSAEHGYIRAVRSDRMVAAVCCETLSAMVRGLRSTSANAYLLGGTSNDALSEKAWLMGPWAVCKHFAAQQLLAVVWGRHDVARQAMTALHPMRHALLGMSHEPLYFLCEAYVVAREENEESKGRLEELVVYFRDHAELNGDYLPLQYTTQALLAKASNNLTEASELFLQAAYDAEERKQPHYEAMAYEQAAEIAESKNRSGLWAFYLKSASAAYLRWGATGKAAALQTRASRPDEQSQPPEATRTASSQVGEDSLQIADVESLFKACQAISSQIRIDDLLRTQVEIAAENLGAQSGMIVLRREEKLVIEVECAVTQGAFQTTRPQRLLRDDDARKALVAHVLRSGRTRNIGEVTADTKFSVALIPTAPASILCSPITSRGVVVGVLYLENCELQHAFAPNAGALNILLSQISSSLDNARLYESLAAEVEQRERAQEVLRLECNYSRQINELNPLIVCGIDPSGCIRFVNKAVEELTGMLGDQLVGTEWAKVFHPKLRRENVSDLVQSLGQPEYSESVVLDALANEHAIVWTFVNHNDATGSLLEVVCFGADMTEGRQAEEDRAEMQAKLLEAQRIETVGTLAASVAHDFNNVLGPIMACGSMLKRMDISGAVNEIAADILQASDRGASLASQLLVVARRPASEQGIIKLQDVLRDVMRLVRASLPATIVIEMDVDLNCSHISGDTNQLHQVILNLCSNAGHAMQDSTNGVLTIRLSEPEDYSEQIHLLGRTCGVPSIRLSIADNGLGIPEAVLEKILDPFFTTKKSGEGTGLGLWGVSQIIESHHGRLGVESTAGEGAEFILSFPKAGEGAGAEPAETKPEPVQGTEIESAGTERVMLVDDEVQTLRIISRMLVDLGYDVTSFDVSSDALMAFERNPDNYDILVTDYTMPQLTGTDLAEAAQRARPHFPVVLVSGLAALIEVGELERANFSEVLAKPLSATGYAAAIRRTITKLQ